MDTIYRYRDKSFEYCGGTSNFVLIIRLHAQTCGLQIIVEIKKTKLQLSIIELFYNKDNLQIISSAAAIWLLTEFMKRARQNI